MPAGRPKTIDDAKIFDVAKPGKSKPVESARPVIANRNNSVQDMTILEPSASQSQNIAFSPSVSRKIISPVSDGNETVATPVTTNITVLHDESPAPETTQETAPIVSAQTAPDLEGANVEATTVEVPATVTVEPIEELPVPVKLTKDRQVVAPAQTVPVQIASVVPRGMKRELRLAPLSEAEATNQAATTTEETKEALDKPEKATEPTAADLSGSTQTDLSSPKQAPVGSESASVDAIAESSDKPKEQRKAEEEALKKEEALNEMIASKKYFVPLARDSTQKGSNKSALIVLLAFIILIAGAYLAIDAKVLKVPVSLPYHFIKQ